MLAGHRATGRRFYTIHKCVTLHLTIEYNMRLMYYLLLFLLLLYIRVSLTCVNISSVREHNLLIILCKFSIIHTIFVTILLFFFLRYSLKNTFTLDEKCSIQIVTVETIIFFSLPNKNNEQFSMINIFLFCFELNGKRVISNCEGTTIID